MAKWEPNRSWNKVNCSIKCITASPVPVENFLQSSCQENYGLVWRRTSVAVVTTGMSCLGAVGSLALKQSNARNGPYRWHHGLSGHGLLHLWLLLQAQMHPACCCYLNYCKSLDQLQSTCSGLVGDTGKQVIFPWGRSMDKETSWALFQTNFLRFCFFVSVFWCHFNKL